MAFIGMNVARDGSVDPRQLRELGASWIRIVAHPDHDLADYLRACQQEALRVLLVLANESFDGVEDAWGRWRKYAPLISALQIGNEPDLDSPSSWTMEPGVFENYGWVARSNFPQVPIVAGGLASGQPDWLDGVNLGWADAIAVHPYLKDAPNERDLEDLEDVPVLLDRYRQYGKPILVTEWGWWGDDEQRGAEEIGDMVRWAAHTPIIEGFFYFCWSDAMVPPFGLFGSRGRRKPAADAFEQAARLAVTSTWPQVLPPRPEPAPSRPDIPDADPMTTAWRLAWQAIVPLPYDDTIAGWGIPTYWRDHYAALGSPLGPEIALGGGTTVQTFASGVLKWTGTQVERIA